MLPISKNTSTRSKKSINLIKYQININVQLRLILILMLFVYSILHKCILYIYT